MSAARTGFSLIELLVVIAIIAVIAAMLFPVARTVRDQAGRGDCASRLRGWGMALTAYTAEQGGLVPGTNAQAPQDLWLKPTTNPAVYPATDLDMATLTGFMDDAPVITGTPTSAATTVVYPRSWRCPAWTPLQPTVYNVADWWYTMPGYLFYGQFRIVGWTASDAAAYMYRQLEPSRLLLTDWSYFYFGATAPRTCHADGQNQLFGDGHVAWRSFSPAEAAIIAIGGAGIPSVSNGICRFYR